MGKRCSICIHTERSEIERRLVAGVSLRQIGSQFDVSATALHRHKKDHLAASLVRSKAVEEVASADTVLDAFKTQIRDIGRLDKEAWAILEQAKEADDQTTVLRAIRELTGVHREMRTSLELLAKVSGELDFSKRKEPSGPMVVVIQPRLELPPGITADLPVIRRVEFPNGHPAGYIEPGETIDVTPETEVEEEEAVELGGDYF